MYNSSAEWVLFPPANAIVAAESGETWFLKFDHREELGPFAEPMTGPGALKSTGALLRGAVSLGFGGADARRKASLPAYVFDLVGSYHNARRTPGHFQAAAKRFRSIDREDIAEYLETHAIEETGHERLVMKDLKALKLPAERIVENLIPEGVRVLCEFFDELTFNEYPIGAIGYSFCFEYTAALKKEPEVEALEALCPPGVDASRFLRTHSGIGSEVGHVDDMVAFIASLPASDRIQIVRAVHDTAVRMGECVRSYGAMTDAEIVALIQTAAGGDAGVGALHS